MTRERISFNETVSKRKGEKILMILYKFLKKSAKTYLDTDVHGRVVERLETDLGHLLSVSLKRMSVERD